MPRTRSADAPLQIAVIGTGIAGMAAAWLLAPRHDVTVFEAAPRVGGHSNTVDVPGPGGAEPVDTGFIVYNEANYPNLVALFDHLGVRTRPSDMSFAVSLRDGAVEYAGSPRGLFAQPGNALRPRHWAMIRDTLRFYRAAPAVLARPDAATLTLGAYLREGGYSRAFVADHLLPMAAAIWSTAADDMRRYPAAAFVRFCLNHGLMRVGGRPTWRTVAGGSRAYVAALTASYAHRIRRGVGVRQLSREDGGVTVATDDGRTMRVDHAVLATHADQALALLRHPTPAERRVLGAFRYTTNRAVLHTDARLMPRRRRVWSSWNYLGGAEGDARREVCVTYWMNRLQGLDPRRDVFVTLNPYRTPDPASVVAAFDYDHPSYDAATLAAQPLLAHIQGRDRLWFCGSYFGAGFHEDALSSGLAAAEALGGARRPWAAVPDSAPPLAVAAE